MEVELTKAQRSFISEHIAKKTPEEIANFLGVDVDVINEFVSRGTKPLPDTVVQAEALTKRLDELKAAGIIRMQDKPSVHSVEFFIQPNGGVGVNFKWPPIKDPEEYINSLGVLLYLVNSGRLKNLVLENLIDIAKKHDMEGIISAVARKWRELDNNNAAEPCIKPREVFG